MTEEMSAQQPEVNLAVQGFELNEAGVEIAVREAAAKLATVNRGDVPVLSDGVTLDQGAVSLDERMKEQVRGVAIALETVARRTDGNSWAAIIGAQAAESQTPSGTSPQG